MKFSKELSPTRIPHFSIQTFTKYEPFANQEKYYKISHHKTHVISEIFLLKNYHQHTFPYPHFLPKYASILTFLAQTRMETLESFKTHLQKLPATNHHFSNRIKTSKGILQNFTFETLAKANFPHTGVDSCYNFRSTVFSLDSGIRNSVTEKRVLLHSVFRLPVRTIFHVRTRISAANVKGVRLMVRG